MKSAPYLGVMALLTIAPSAFAVGDPARGEKLHASCLQCHGTELYVPPKARIKSLAALKKEVARWGDYYNPRFSKQDVEDLVEWLNRNFYKLEK